MEEADESAALVSDLDPEANRLQFLYGGTVKHQRSHIGSPAYGLALSISWEINFDIPRPSPCPFLREGEAHSQDSLPDLVVY
jgi:hypothetical protein